MIPRKTFLLKLMSHSRDQPQTFRLTHLWLKQLRAKENPYPRVKRISDFAAVRNHLIQEGLLAEPQIRGAPSLLEERSDSHQIRH